MQIILKYFPELSEQQKNQFEQLHDIFIEWNAQINLVSRKDINQLYTHHILHSLAIAKLVKFNPKAKIMDVGTGGGFPGIPLAIMFPSTEFLLIDSIGKKIKVVNDIIERLGLNNATARITRAENVNQKFDFIVSRAVTQLPKFYDWVKNNISRKPLHTIPNGIIYLKGGDLTEELAPFENWYTEKNIKDYFEDEFFETKKVIHLFK